MIFIVVPAYNEAYNIGRVISGLFSRGYKNVIVVDDGSVDFTGDNAEQSGAIVLRHRINRGQGAALQTGNEYALARGAEAVVHFDADDQFDADDIGLAIDYLKNNKLDALVGSRFLDNRSKIPFTKKYFILPLARFFNFLFTGVRLTDAHNGFRVLSKNTLQKITITQDGMAHNSEIIKSLKKNNLSFAEFPVKVTYSEYGQGIKGGFKIIWDLFFNSISK